MIRWILIALVALLAFGFGSLSPGNAHAETVWRDAGRNPAYATRQEAIADAPRVLREFGWSQPAVDAMVQEMRTNAGTPCVMRQGERYDRMRFGRRGVVSDVVNRTGRDQPGVCYTVTVAGVRYEAFIPDICRNLSGRRIVPPPCVTILVPARLVEQDAVVNVGVLYTDTQPDESRCEIGVQGPGTGTGGLTFARDGYQRLSDCERHPCDWRMVLRATGQRLYRSGSFEVTADGWYAIRVPAEFATNPSLRVVLCLTKADGTTTTMGLGVQHFDYRERGSERVAVVWYNQTLATRQNEQTLFWRWTRRPPYAVAAR